MLIACFLWVNVIDISYVVLQGATIKKDEHSGAIIVARIMRGGAADRSGGC